MDPLLHDLDNGISLLPVTGQASHMDIIGCVPRVLINSIHLCDPENFLVLFVTNICDGMIKLTTQVALFTVLELGHAIRLLVSWL